MKKTEMTAEITATVATADTIQERPNLIELADYSMVISKLRAYLHLSQALFVKPLGLSPTQIARFEKSVYQPDSEMIKRICETYRVDPRYFEEPGLSGDLSVEEAVELQNPEAGIPTRLKQARFEKGWSQYELGGHSGVDQSMICRIELGAKLTERQGKKLAAALEVGMMWLMKGEEHKKAYPADQKMIDWLWEHEEVRKEIWERMKAEEQAGK